MGRGIEGRRVTLDGWGILGRGIVRRRGCSRGGRVMLGAGRGV